MNNETYMNTLKETNFANLGTKKTGKVRDIYTQPDKLVLISTDRHSSFDRIIAHIPHKGQVLNQTAAFWFEGTKDIIQNHVISVPDPNVLVTKKCAVIPIEMVMRGFITRTTNTSLWTLYQAGQRDFGSFVLPDGMKKNQRLDAPVVTPTTKSDEHDRPITPKEIVAEGIVSEAVWKELERVAVALFARGQELALAHGLILVDTKYEFGLDAEGKLTLIDELHTPDSSRYWKADTYEARIKEAKDPEDFDKEFLRIWFKEHCDPYKDAVLPEAPAEMVEELSRRYIQIYEQLTGKKFQFDSGVPILERIEKNIKDYTI